MIARRRTGGRRTLSARVSNLALAVIAGWVIVLAAGFDFALSSRVDQQIDDALRVRAQAASATVLVRNAALVAVRESATDSELDDNIWVFRGTRAITPPHGPAAVQQAARRLAGSDGVHAEAGDRRLYRLPLRAGGREVGQLIAGIDTEPYEKTRQLAILGSVVVAALLIGGAYPVLRYATTRALNPVAVMTRQAADWSVSAPNQRFGAGQRYAELVLLANTLDGLLDRLASVLRHERMLSAELSHELRTPLARLMAEVDLMLADAQPVQRPALLAIRANCATITAIIDTLLAAARSELAQTVGHTDLGPILQAFATDRGSPIVAAEPTELPVGVEADVATRILSPIVDNARRYANSEVRLAARRAGAGIAVTVSNDGPPLPAELAERVFEPGFTTADLDPATDPGDDGRGDGRGEYARAGLGLALARRLARAADGDLTVDTAAAQTTFRLTLPAG